MSFSARVEDEIDQASTSKPFALRTMEYRKDKDNIQFRFKCDNDANANEGNYKIDSNWQGFKFEKGSSSSFPLIDLEQQQIKFNEWDKQQVVFTISIPSDKVRQAYDNLEPQVEPDWQYKLEQKDKKIARLEKNNKQMLELINSSPIILEQLKKDLINACKIGDLAKIKFLIETMKVDPNYTNFDAITLPYTLLEVACSYGHIDIVKYFIEQIKMDPNIIDIKGYNVLFYARSRDMAKYLVEQAKVDPNIKSRYGTVSEEAVKNSLLDIVKYFIEELHLEPNIIDSAGRTILHYATRDKDMTKYLIEQVKMDPNVKDSKGQMLYIMRLYSVH